MNTKATYTFVSNSSEETSQLAAKLATLLSGGETLVFLSDVGGGKTTFIKALVAALGSTDHVSSPTFTVSRVYTAQHLKVVHFDFYRLHDATGVKEALHEHMQDNTTICCIEWPALVSGVLPDSYLQIQIEKDPVAESKRTIHIASIHMPTHNLERLL